MERHAIWRALRPLLPRWYRDRFGDELLLAHVDRHGNGGGPWFWVRVAWDVALTAGGARIGRRTWKNGEVGGRGMSGLVEGLMRDTRVALRGFARSPLVSVSIALALAVGIGANVGVFSIVHHVLLRPLDFEDPDELVQVLGTTDRGLQSTLSLPDILDLADGVSAFDGVFARTFHGGTLLGHGDPRQLSGSAVTANYFDVLGIEPYRGRFFLPGEDTPGREAVLVLSHALWTGLFGSDPEIVGSSLRIEDEPYRVVGVAGPGFRGESSQTSYWTAARPDRGRGGRSFAAVARLADGVTLEQAEAEAESVAAGMAEAYPDTNRGRGIALMELKELVVRSIRRTLILFSVGAAFVLLIVCTNVSSLFLSQSVARRREIGLRRALGASRRVAVRHILVEAGLLAVIGAVLGVALGSLSIDLILSMAGELIPRSDTVGMTPVVAGFGMLLTVLVTFAVGALPGAVWAGTVGAEAQMDGTRATDGRGVRRGQRILVVAQLTLATVLLSSAGLLFRSLRSLEGADIGIRAENVLTFRISPSADRHPSGAPLGNFYRTFLSRIEAAPGVVAAGANWSIPLSGWGNSTNSIWREDGVTPLQGEMSPQERSVTWNFFAAAGVPVVRGRGLLPEDQPGAPAVVIINEAFVAAYYADRDPLGERLVVRDVPREIVGIVRDVRQRDLATPAEPAFFTPHAQEQVDWLRREMGVLVRSDRRPEELMPAIRQALEEIDPTIPITDVQTLSQVVSQQSLMPRLRTILAGLFASIALFVSCLGVYAVLSHGVSRRRREIGTRMALGEAGWRVMRGFLGEGVMLAVPGVLVGGVGGLVASGALSTLMYEVDAGDPTHVGVTAAVVVLIALLASGWPAYRAARINPALTLRVE